MGVDATMGPATEWRPSGARPLRLSFPKMHFMRF